MPAETPAGTSGGVQRDGAEPAESAKVPPPPARDAPPAGEPAESVVGPPPPGGEEPLEDELEDDEDDELEDEPEDSAVERALRRLLPVSAQVVEGEDGNKSGRFVLLGEWYVQVPVVVIWIYPAVIFAALALIWFVFFRDASRKGLSWQLFFESTMCFPCLWANLTSKFKFLTACRAWFYVVLLACAICLVNFFSFYAPAHEMAAQTSERLRLVLWIGVPSIAALWTALSCEAACVRKAMRRGKDPTAESYLVADFLCSFFCAPCTSLQEAEFMAYEEPPQDAKGVFVVVEQIRGEPALL